MVSDARMRVVARRWLLTLFITPHGSREKLHSARAARGTRGIMTKTERWEARGETGLATAIKGQSGSFARCGSVIC
jgi:hypothetical protein